MIPQQLFPLHNFIIYIYINCIQPEKLKDEIKNRFSKRLLGGWLAACQQHQQVSVRQRKALKDIRCHYGCVSQAQTDGQNTMSGVFQKPPGSSASYLGASGSSVSLSSIQTAESLQAERGERRLEEGGRGAEADVGADAVHWSQHSLCVP